MKQTTIFLNGMKFYAYHGCFEEEQKIGTHFVVDATLTYDAEAAVADDDVEKSVNYLLVYRTIQRVMDKPQHLIETVADHIVREIKREFPQVQKVTVKLCKLNPPLDGKTEYVAVQMEG
ncbi:MAG: dihydroneopterin aldolase [Bacteroidales bacterium]|jgi:dihydroneopterin aldolase|nr:dihydroneopterin aldolase [Bacteroidales bacterium]